jgi:hypothetical protein
MPVAESTESSKTIGSPITRSMRQSAQAASGDLRLPHGVPPVVPGEERRVAHGEVTVAEEEAFRRALEELEAAPIERGRAHGLDGLDREAALSVRGDPLAEREALGRRGTELEAAHAGVRDAQEHVAALEQRARAVRRDEGLGVALRRAVAVAGDRAEREHEDRRESRHRASPIDPGATGGAPPSTTASWRASGVDAVERARVHDAERVGARGLLGAPHHEPHDRTGGREARDGRDHETAPRAAAEAAVHALFEHGRRVEPRQVAREARRTVRLGSRELLVDQPLQHGRRGLHVEGAEQSGALLATRLVAGRSVGDAQQHAHVLVERRRRAVLHEARQDALHAPLAPSRELVLDAERELGGHRESRQAAQHLDLLLRVPAPRDARGADLVVAGARLAEQPRAAEDAAGVVHGVTRGSACPGPG